MRLSPQRSGPSSFPEATPAEAAAEVCQTESCSDLPGRDGRGTPRGATGRRHRWRQHPFPLRQWRGEDGPPAAECEHAAPPSLPPDLERDGVRSTLRPNATRGRATSEDATRDRSRNHLAWEPRRPRDHRSAAASLVHAGGAVKRLPPGLFAHSHAPTIGNIRTHGSGRGRTVSGVGVQRRSANCFDWGKDLSECCIPWERRSPNAERGPWLQPATASDRTPWVGTAASADPLPPREGPRRVQISEQGCWGGHRERACDRGRLLRA